MKNLPQLLSACYDGINNPDFKPQFNPDGTVKSTFCNEFVDSVAQEMGCQDFAGKMANEIIDLMAVSPNWVPVLMQDAQSKANVGSLVVAGLKADPHGHVCIVVPGIPVQSEHWNCRNPLCCNIGQQVFIGRGLSWTFRQEPQLWAWKPSL